MPILNAESVDEIRVPIQRDIDIILARQKGRHLAAQLGFLGTEVTMIAAAISELSRNILNYAKEGELILKKVQKSAQVGLVIQAIDQGPGIADIEQALKDGFSTGHGLGLGLPGTRRLMDEFEIQSEVGKGTIVTVKKWVK